MLSSALRWFLGLFGLLLLMAGAALTATELRIAYLAWPYWPGVWAALACALITLAGGLLLRGAVRGTFRRRAPAALTS